MRTTEARRPDHGGEARSRQPAREQRLPRQAPFEFVLALQRTVGNQAAQRILRRAEPPPADSGKARDGGGFPLAAAGVPASGSEGRLVAIPGADVGHPVAASLAAPDVRFRIPEFARLKAAYTDKDLAIPEKVIQDRVAALLGRMEHEGRLQTADDVPTIISKIFPAPGVIDETEFNNALDETSQKVIYKSVLDANTTVKPADKAKLKTAMKDSADLVTKVEGDAAGLKQVFGSKDGTAKANYAKTKKALDEVRKDLDNKVSTDYNLDDPEVGLGGWASFSQRHMHLLMEVVKGTDPNETKATLIHEAAHLSDPSVDDHVYYNVTGFFEAEEDIKVANAAHYEELPRREMGASSFDKMEFKPGVKASGGAVTREDTVRADVANYLRKAWDAAVDVHTFIRGVRKAYLQGSKKPFADNKAIIVEISKLMDLTIHEQDPAHAIVTTLDVTLTESIARGTIHVQQEAESVPFPSPVGSMTDPELVEKIVADAVAAYGNLLKDAARDKALLDWLVAHYRGVPSV